MKLINIDHPVKRSWLAEQGLRLDSSPYLSGSFEAKQVLKELTVHKDALASLTTGHNGGIFHAGRVSRRWVYTRKHGVPFFSSTDIMEADSSFLPLIARSSVEENPNLIIDRDWTLVTRSGTVGRITYSRRDMVGLACSEHVMRVQPDPSRIPPGYLNTFLRSRFGVPMITSQAYGAIIQHIEPHHIADLPVPRFEAELEQRIHGLVQKAADLRADFQHGVVAATEDLFTTAGLPQLLNLNWHEQDRDLRCDVFDVGAQSLRAINYGNRAREILSSLSNIPSRTLGQICENGQLSRGNRFNRVESEEGYGVPFVGQRQAFWLRPEIRWIRKPENGDLRADNETVMITSRGLPSENGLFGRATFITGPWVNLGYTEDFLRVRSGDPQYPGAFLFAFLRSEVAFRLFRSMMSGTGPQAIHPYLRAQIPIPTLTAEARIRIAETVREAYRKRDEADLKEDQALALLESAVFEHAGGSGGASRGKGAEV